MRASSPDEIVTTRRQNRVTSAVMTRRSLYAVLVVAIAACGDDTSSTKSDANLAQCGSIGMACSGACANGLECINGHCAPMRGDCGGFAGAECQDTSLTCAYPAGSSGGICMRPDEKDCLCAIAPSTLGDCPQP